MRTHLVTWKQFSHQKYFEFFTEEPLAIADARVFVVGVGNKVLLLGEPCAHERKLSDHESSTKLESF